MQTSQFTTFFGPPPMLLFTPGIYMNFENLYARCFSYFFFFFFLLLCWCLDIFSTLDLHMGSRPRPPPKREEAKRAL